MKKLSLNKKVIAKLNDPSNIYGGVTYGYDGDTRKKLDVFSVDPLYCNSGPLTVCEPTKMWHCPSVDYSYCNSGPNGQC